MSQPIPVTLRIPCLVGGFICLALGVVGGLARLGWSFPATGGNLAALHAPLMISGFLGTVISLERAVALGGRWAYLAPLFAAVGSFLLLTESGRSYGALLIVLASGVMLLASAQIFLRQRALFTLTLLLGSLCWSIGNLLWASGLTVAQAVPWWLNFLILTIAGERLELTRMLPPSRHGSRLFVGIVMVFLGGAIVATVSPMTGIALPAAASALLALWLMWFDIARKTIRRKALTRYIAVCLLSGYVWLLAGGLTGLLFTPLLPGSSYDAFLHAILLGFVFSMIFGHVPVIFPAVTGFKIPYHTFFYLPLAVLHLSLLIRISGDLLQLSSWRHTGAMLNVLALFLFVLNTVTAVIRGRRQRYSSFQPRNP